MSFDEIEAWSAGSETIDNDVIIKAKEIAIQRGIEIEPAAAAKKNA